jgi:hypothetical protein
LVAVGTHTGGVCGGAAAAAVTVATVPAAAAAGMLKTPPKAAAAAAPACVKATMVFSHTWGPTARVTACSTPSSPLERVGWSNLQMVEAVQRV